MAIYGEGSPVVRVHANMNLVVPILSSFLPNSI